MSTTKKTDNKAATPAEIQNKKEAAKKGSVTNAPEQLDPKTGEPVAHDKAAEASAKKGDAPELHMDEPTMTEERTPLEVPALTTAGQPLSAYDDHDTKIKSWEESDAGKAWIKEANKTANEDDGGPRGPKK